MRAPGARAARAAYLAVCWVYNSPGRPMRILVVEDDKKGASFLEKGLREERYSVDVAHDGDDGIFKANVYDYDLAVLDIMLPGRSGYEIVRELRKGQKTLPAVSYTHLT